MFGNIHSICTSLFQKHDDTKSTWGRIYLPYNLTSSSSKDTTNEHDEGAHSLHI